MSIHPARKEVSPEGPGTWHSAGFDDGRNDYERFVRAWQPGDGIKCSSQRANSAKPCGVPVAVETSVYAREGDPGRYGRRSVTRNLCLGHLAARFTEVAPWKTEQQIDTIAYERLAANHWDEYQQIIVEEKDNALRQRLSCLPKELQDSVIARMEADDE